MIFALLLSEFILFIYATISYYNGKKTDDYSGSIRGIIKNIKERKYNTYISTYYLTIQYTVDDSMYQNKHMKITGNDCQYTIGQEMDIVYDINKPSRSKAINDSSYATSKVLWIIFSSICITSLIIPFYDSIVDSDLFLILSILIAILSIIIFTIAKIIDVLKKRERSLLSLFITLIIVSSAFSLELVLFMLI